MIPQWANSAISDSSWFAFGVAATLFAAFVANRNGRIQISLMRRGHDLNVKRARCKLGTHCRTELRFLNPIRTDIQGYVILTTIYNAGELAATNIEGKWNLSCSENIYDRVTPFHIDSITKERPHELEPYQFLNRITTQAIMSGQFRINVDIDLEFMGLDDEESEKYHARYEYSHQQKQMIRID
jgi:hypothetical protein